jgi:signal transduction histidine kinase
MGSLSLSVKTNSFSNGASTTHQRLSGLMEGRHFERFIEELSISLVCLPVAEIRAEIDRWLKEIVLGNDLDRAAITQIDPKSGKLVVRQSWSRDNRLKLPDGFEVSRPAPWFDNYLMSGQTLVYSKVSEVPREFVSKDWNIFRHYIPKSNISVPLRMAGDVVGSVGFASFRREREWSPRSVRRFESVAAIIGSALERRRAVEENTLLRHELSHVARAAVMGQLTASLTHQLNQPVAAALSNAEAIQSMLESEHPDLEELRAAISDVVQDNLRAGDVIKGLRLFFRKDQIQKIPVDLGQLVADVVRMLGSDTLFRNASLTFESPPSLPLNVTVSDSGKGIDPAIVPRMYEPFFTTKPTGMGMGLAIAQSIVRAHGGSLTARLNAVRGSTFEISFPASEKELPAT